MNESNNIVKKDRFDNHKKVENLFEYNTNYNQNSIFHISTEETNNKNVNIEENFDWDWIFDKGWLRTKK